MKKLVLFCGMCTDFFAMTNRIETIELPAHALQHCEDLYQQTTNPHQIHDLGLSLADYHELYQAAHAKRKIKHISRILQKVPQEEMVGIARRHTLCLLAPKRHFLLLIVAEEHQNFLHNNNVYGDCIIGFFKRKHSLKKLKKFLAPYQNDMVVENNH